MLGIATDLSAGAGCVLFGVAQKSALPGMSPLTEDEIQGCYRAFQAFDSDNSGSIDHFELKAVLMSMGQTPSDEEIMDLMAQVDEDNSGAINFSEFLAMVEFQKAFAQVITGSVLSFDN